MPVYEVSYEYSPKANPSFLAKGTANGIKAENERELIDILTKRCNAKPDSMKITKLKAK